MRRSFLLVIGVGALWLAGCGGGSPAPAPATPAEPKALAPEGPPPLRDVTDAVGISFRYDNGRSDARYMPEIMGAGAALFDADNDGDLDLYLIQGGPLDDPTTPRQDRLLRNELTETGTLRFTDVTDEAAIPGTAYGMGVATGDVDGDGHIDLYLTNAGPNVLLRNRGDGTFEDITATAGAEEPLWSVPTSFLDIDGDGDHDLFVGNYVDFRVANHKDCFTPTGLSDYCSPSSYSATYDRLLRNRGDGTFDNVSADAGIRATRSKSLGVISGDFNDDGHADLYVANDGVANQLWMNRGDGTFVEEALLAGCAVNFEGSPEASMGVDAGDVDGDGDEDIFMTHLRGETNTLYVNRGNAVFEDRTLSLGLAANSLRYTGFGTAWFDLENDGRLDLLAVNGAVTAEEELLMTSDAFPYHQPNQLFRQASDGEALQFRVAASGDGDPLARSHVSRGAAFGDLDNDGDTDIVITNNDGPVRVLRNEVGQAYTWVGMRVRVAPGGADALGAQVRVRADDGRTAVQRVRTAGSYVSANDPRVLFGLGADDPGQVTVRVRWSDGTYERFGPLPTRRYHELVRGTGAPEA